MNNADFSRTLALLRQEKGVSQRRAAADLGISQALLSHYENGVREPGLVFVRRACDYYRVSADYLLGRSLDRYGTLITADELYDSSEEKGTLRGSITATLQKKLLVNTTNLLLDLLGRTGSRDAVTAAAAYLGGALYQLYRALHHASGGKDNFFSVDAGDYAADVVDAEMRLRRVAYLRAVEEAKESIPPMDDETLSVSYPGMTQSASQVFHNTEEAAHKLLER